MYSHRPYSVDRNQLKSRNFGFEWIEDGLYRGKVINDIAQSIKKPEDVSLNLWFANNFVKMLKELSMVRTSRSRTGKR